MSNKFIVKAISIAVAIAISSPSFALPTGNDFPRKMPLTAYIAKSMASEEDLEKMALKYFNSAGIQNPFSVVDDQIRKEFREQQIGRLSSGDLIGYQTKSDQSLGASTFNKYKMREAGSIGAEKLERILGAKPPMNEWLPSYLTRFVAATYVGGRVIPTWPSGANPLYGSITGTDERGEPFWYINPDSPLYDEYKDRKESRFWGRSRYASFPRLPSSVLDSDIESARVFMHNTVIALLYTHLVAGLFDEATNVPHVQESVNSVPLPINIRKPKSDLFKALDKEESLFSIGMGFVDYSIPSKATYKSEWAHAIFGGEIGNPNNLDSYKSGAAYIERTASEMIYIPLSKAGEPIKFAFKPIKRGKLRWALVEFSKNGLIVRTLQDETRDFPIVKKLQTFLLPSSYLCQEAFRNSCYDYGFGNFDNEIVYGLSRFVKIPKTLHTKTEQFVDALEEASNQLPDSGVQTNKPEDIQLPKPGEKIDFWGSENQAK